MDIKTSSDIKEILIDMSETMHSSSEAITARSEQLITLLELLASNPANHPKATELISATIKLCKEQDPKLATALQGAGDMARRLSGIIVVE